MLHYNIYTQNLQKVSLHRSHRVPYFKSGFTEQLELPKYHHTQQIHFSIPVSLKQQPPRFAGPRTSGGLCHIEFCVAK